MIKVYKIKVGEKVYEVEVESVTEKEGTILKEKIDFIPEKKHVSTQGEKIEAPMEEAVVAVEEIESPMQGAVVSIEVTVGQKINKGNTLLIIEAMKMENPIVSPIDGTVVSILTSKGATVEGGDVLVVVA